MCLITCTDNISSAVQCSSLPAGYVQHHVDKTFKTFRTFIWNTLLLYPPAMALFLKCRVGVFLSCGNSCLPLTRKAYAQACDHTVDTKFFPTPS